MTTKTLKQWVEETQEFPLEQSMNKEAFAYVIAQMSLNLRNVAKPTFPEKDNSESNTNRKLTSLNPGVIRPAIVPPATHPRSGIYSTIKRCLRKLSAAFDRPSWRNRDNSNTAH